MNSMVGVLHSFIDRVYDKVVHISEYTIEISLSNDNILYYIHINCYVYKYIYKWVKANALLQFYFPKLDTHGSYDRNSIWNEVNKHIVC